LGIKDVIGTETSFGTVRGLIADFHMFSLKEEIPPMILNLSPSSGRQMIIRISTQNIPHTIDQIKNTWESFEGGDPFDITFTDDALNEIYESEIRFSKTIGILAFIAILIASLGLLGLSLFSGKQRIKEIGVRKSNGAKTIEIVQMLNQDFMKLVIIAFILACPIAWFIMKQWLQNFAFKTEMSWWIFALSGIIAMGIAIITVTWQSWRAARRNPVESLRYE
jgi:putative ABC transport system permease protein